MRSGSLRHKLKIYQLSSTPDAFGAIDNSYTLWKTVPARVEHRTFRERSEQGDKLSRIEFKITVRHNDEIAAHVPTSELEINGRRLRTLAVTDPKGMSRELHIYAEEVK